MILYNDGDFIVFKEDTLRTINLREANANRLEIVRYLIQDWSIEEELNIKNISKLKPVLINELLDEAIKPYNIILNFSQMTLKNFIKATFTSNKVNFGVLGNDVGNLVMSALNGAQEMFDDKANMILLPRDGGFQDQPAHLMFILRIYRRVLSEQINKKRKRNNK